MSDSINPPLTISSRDRLIHAAQTVFTRYGYRRTSMADVAAEAGLSRPAIYQWFSNKAALFRALAVAMKDSALAEAQAAWPDGAPLAEGLPAAILGKDLLFMRLLHQSPHGAELMAVDADMTAQIARQMEAGFAGIMAAKIAVLEAEGSVQLTAFGTPAEFGATIGLLASGLKHEAASEAAYLDGVKRLCRVVAAACALPLPTQ